MEQAEKRIYAEFYKLSQAENRLRCTEEIMCHSKLNLQTQPPQQRISHELLSPESQRYLWISRKA